MLGIKDAFKRIYSPGENTFIKHTILFVLTGITSIFSVVLNEYSKQQSIDTINWIWAMVGVLFLIGITIYLIGYNLTLMHNSFDEFKNDIVPEIDKSHFSVFGKAFPLIFAWFSYGILFYIAGLLVTLALGINFINVIAGSMLVAIGVIGIFLQFVYVKFAKNFERKGLYSIALPIKYIQPTVLALFKLWIKFIPLLILNIILSFFAEGHNVFAYIFTAISGYVSFISGFIYSFCLVQIFKEKIEPLEQSN